MPHPPFSRLFLLATLLLSLFFPSSSALVTHPNGSFPNYDPLYTFRLIDSQDVYIHNLVIDYSKFCQGEVPALAQSPNITLLNIGELFIYGFANNTCDAIGWDHLLRKVQLSGTAGVIVITFPDFVSPMVQYVNPLYTHDDNFFLTMAFRSDAQELITMASQGPVKVSVTNGFNPVQAFYLSPGFTAIHVIFGLIYLLIILYLLGDLVMTLRKMHRFSFGNFRLMLALFGSILCLLQMAHMFTMVAKRPGAYPGATSNFLFYSSYVVFYLCYVLMLFAWLRAITNIVGVDSPKVRIGVWAARIASIITTMAIFVFWCGMAAYVKFTYLWDSTIKGFFYLAAVAWLVQAIVSLIVGLYLFSLLNFKSEINQADIIKRLSLVTVGCIFGFLGSSACVIYDNLVDTVSVLSFWYLAVLEVLMLVMFLSIIFAVHFNFKLLSSQHSHSQSQSHSKSGSKQVSQLSSSKGKENEHVVRDVTADPIDQFRMEAKTIQDA